MIVGHTGASSIAPENSLKSFQKAIELNADFIEFDLRLSKDGEIVIIHDENTLDTTGHNGLVNKMTLRELKQLDNEGEKIPTLIELIKIAKGKIKLQPEIKVPGITQDLVSILRKNILIESSIVSCFEIVELLKIKEIEPTLKIGYLIPRVLTNKRMVKRYIQRAIKNELYAIHPYYQVVDREFIELAHDNGLKVNVWTVNEESMMRKLIDLGVDGIMTDDLALLNQVLGRSY
ncbi:MAG: glycerophosphodiester phosphodiesterase [Candidatus Lokiarchaeota archaeon]|nr:glycerophosphodiester phosphodiesterase [Candidatus Lokiarchaeota archaeon]